MDLFDFKEVKYLERDTNTPTFLGEIKSEAGKGGQVMITLGDRNFFVDINPQDGSWKWTPPEALADGEYSISFMTIDTAGNVSTPTQRTLIIDTTPPVAPTLLNLYDDQGAITGSFDAGKMTDDRRPTLTGIAEKGTVVYLKEGNNVIGSAKADEKTGLWTLEPTVDLADGRHNLTLVAAETFADKLREGKPSDEFSIIIGKDGDVPSDPGGVAKIIEAIDNAGSLNGSLKSGGITDDTTPELRGSAPEGSVVRIQYRNEKGEWIDGGNAVMNGNSWSWTPNPALAAGNWEFRANAGSGWTDEFKLDIDLAPAAKTEITHAYDDFGPYTGMLGNGAITDDRTPNLHGRAESNSLVYIHYRNVLGAWELLDTVTAGADGRWEYETDRLSPGTYEFQAGTSATRDVKGKPFGLQIVEQGTVISEIDSVWDDFGGSQGKLSNNSLTDDTTPTLKGTAEANSIVVIEVKSGSGQWVNYGSVKADMLGNWSYTSNTPLDYNLWQFRSHHENNHNYSKPFTLNIIEQSSGFESFEKSPDGSSNYYKFELGRKIESITGLNYELLKNSTVSTIYQQISRGSLQLGASAEIKIDFIVKTHEISFTCDSVHKKGSVVDIYNSKGELIKTIQLSDITSKKTYHYTANNDEDIAYIIIKVSPNEVDDSGKGGAILIDDLTWGISTLTNSSFDENKEENTFLHQQDNEGLCIYENQKHDQKSENISLHEILIHGQKDLFIDDGKTQLMVNGNQGDTVRLEDILPEGSEQNGWAEQAGTVTIAGTQYHVWSNGDAELLVQDGVKTELV